MECGRNLAQARSTREFRAVIDPTFPEIPESFFCWHMDVSPVSSQLSLALNHIMWWNDLVVSVRAGLAIAMAFWLWGLILFFVVLSVCILRVWLLIERPVQASAPISPFTLKDLKESFRNAVQRHRPYYNALNQHWRLAAERAFLENWCRDRVRTVSRNFRDIGGSVRRNNRFGMKAHVCHPLLTSSDCAHVKDIVVRCDARDHTLAECDEKHLMGLMSYVDWHIGLKELADGIKAPTFVITHIFPQGESSFYDGEAVLSVRGNHVQMSVAGGANYNHRFHHWENEGWIMGNTGVVQYQSIGAYGHSRVLLLEPAKGPFLPSTPGRLVDPHPNVVKTPTGRAEETRSSWEFYNKENEHMGSVSKSTINRAAFTCYGAPRDEKYARNLNAMIRARMTADKQNQDLLFDVVPVVQMLADNMILDHGHKYRILSEVENLTWWGRTDAKLRLWVYRSLPLKLREWFTIDMLFGRSKDRSWMPYLWKDIAADVYEVVEGDVETLGDSRRPLKSPFRCAGACDTAPIDGVVKRNSDRDSGERDGKPAVEGVKTSLQTSSDDSGRVTVSTLSLCSSRSSVGSNSSSSVWCPSSRRGTINIDGDSQWGQHRQYPLSSIILGTKDRPVYSGVSVKKLAAAANGNRSKVGNKKRAVDAQSAATSF